MTNHTLDIHTSTVQGIDNYVDTLTNTITKTIDGKVQSKTLKPNSVGLPKAIRDLIKENEDKDDTGNRQDTNITRLTTTD